MIGYEHTRNRKIVQIFRKLFDVIEKAGGFNEYGFAVFLHNENFIVNQIVGLIGVQLHGAEIVNIHLALHQMIQDFQSIQ